MQLYDFQKGIVRSANATVQEHKSVAIQLPTGAGKTVVASEMVRQQLAQGNRVLFLVHRWELLEQARKTFNEWGLNPAIIYSGGAYSGGFADVDIAMVMTLKNRVNQMAPNFYQMIITDECHHATAGTWQKILDYHNKTKHIGLTATPIRNDSSGLGDIYNAMIIGPSVRQLIDNKYLSEYRLYSSRYWQQLWDGVRIKGKEFDYKKFEEANKKKLMLIIADTVEQYKKYCNGDRCLFFGYSVKNSIDVAEQFNREGIVADHVDGSMDKAVRAHKIKLFRDGVTTVLCNFNVVSEGFDTPECSALIIGRKTASLITYMQIVGRVLRYREGKVSKILDLTGNYVQHGLPCDKRKWELEKGDDSIKYYNCKECGYTFPKYERICAECGTAIPTRKANKSPVPQETATFEFNEELELIN